MDQVERGFDVLITNPELVNTGLDLLDFPTIALMPTGYNMWPSGAHDRVLGDGGGDN